ncbi:Mur ligase family protein [Inediibacterium massiliense]|uniref:Mur ligase family protein n=1 Tax=Inediibacterium massiliense TaxID=1658111 RepID=UPI0006B6814D|nr:Mur ligase family protein [Inediibacterium massiliense]
MYIQNGSSMKIIGIAGGSGKTIMAQWMAYLFEKHGLKIANISSKGTYIDNEIINKKNNVLDEMIKRKVDVLIIEINHNSLSELCENFYLDTIIYTYMNKNYTQEELAVYKKILNRLNENSIIIWNADDLKNINILEHAKNKMIITYGFCSKATITASSIDEASFVKFYCCIQRGFTTHDHMEIYPMEFPVEVRRVDRNHIYSILGAITGVLMYGILPEYICKYLNLVKEKN